MYDKPSKSKWWNFKGSNIYAMLICNFFLSNFLWTFSLLWWFYVWDTFQYDASIISNKPGYKSCHFTLLASTLIFPAKPKEKRQVSNKQATCCAKFGSWIVMLSIVIPPLYDQNNNEQNKTHKLSSYLKITEI